MYSPHILNHTINYKAKKLFFAFPALITVLFGAFAADNSFASGDWDVRVELAPSLHVAVPNDSVNLTLSPVIGNPAFASQNMSVFTATNNPTGYTLMMEADSTDLTRTAAYNNRMIVFLAFQKTKSSTAAV